MVNVALHSLTESLQNLALDRTLYHDMLYNPNDSVKYVEALCSEAERIKKVSAEVFCDREFTKEIPITRTLSLINRDNLDQLLGVNVGVSIVTDETAKKIKLHRGKFGRY